MLTHLISMEKKSEKAVTKSSQEEMKEFLENRRNKKITKKVFLEQQLLNINQVEFKFKKDVAVRMDQQDKSFNKSMERF